MTDLVNPISSQDTVLNAAMSAALMQYENNTGLAFPTVPRLEPSDDPDFWAEVELVGSECVIIVTQGLIATVDGFWHEVVDHRTNIPGTVEDMIHNSLVWLLLHELHHYQMGHFAFMGKFRLTEAKEPNSFGVVRRASQTRPLVLSHIKDEDLPKVEPCLEMQADHDATEMLLDAYSLEGWDIIRARTAAISAMMVLIERADSKRNHDISSHPKAATRIFQLLGHVIQMPMIEATLAKQHPELGISPNIPSDEEQSKFNREVVIPVFLDAVKLADIAGAASIAKDLGSPQDFFEDIQTAHLGTDDLSSTFKTIGAAQWAELIDFNGTISTGQEDT